MRRAALSLIACVVAVDSLALTIDLDRTGLMSWTNGTETSGYYRVDYFMDASLTNPLHAWAPTTIVNNAALNQSLSLPWAYRLTWTSATNTPDTTNNVPADWYQMPLSSVGSSISWLNLDDVTTYALGWKLTTTDTVWRLNWSPFLDLTVAATSSVRVPIHFALFLRRQYVDQPADMARIIAPAFTMGDTIGDGDSDEKPTRAITTSLYMIDLTEVTESRWSTIRAWAVSNGYTDLPAGSSTGTNYPVRGVSWHDCAKWLNAQSEYDNEIPEYRLATGTVYRTGTAAVSRAGVNGYRLPTEAEWEKAAGGSGGEYGCGVSYVTVWAQSYSTSAADYVYVTNPMATYRDAPRTTSAPVSAVGSISKSAWNLSLNTNMSPDSVVNAAGYSDANAFGQRDMAGNVWEWCEDWYGAYDTNSLADPTGPTSGTRRVIRGGGWCSKPADLRVSARNSLNPTTRNRGVGFRSVKRPILNESGANFLVVYNTNDGSSVSLANYYVATRPGITGATMLGVGTTNGEIVTWADFTNQIFNPITSILATNSAIRFVVMMFGLPTRSSTLYQPSFALSENFAVSSELSYAGARTRYLPAGYLRSRALVTYLTGRTAVDVSNYIARLAAHYDGHGRISGGQSNGWYVLDDVGSEAWSASPGRDASNAIRTASATAKIVYRGTGTTHVTVWSNVTGYLSWGSNGGLGAGYATNGTVTFSGTNWYLIETIESYNGQLSGGQGSVYDWMAPTAFGGTNYENCPIGAVCHVDEPNIVGINNQLYFQLWESGLSFAECAWASRGGGLMMAVGDPLVSK